MARGWMWVKDPEAMYQFKVTLRGITPRIWRRILVGDADHLDRFSTTILAAMGWHGGHLHRLSTGQRSFSARNQFGVDAMWEDTSEDENEAGVSLSSLGLARKSRLLYEYDFGDGWEHDLVLEDILPVKAEDKLPRCIDGARNGPPEDCGGPQGYAQLLRVLADARDPEHRDMKRWVGGSYDPEKFSVRATNRRLGPLHLIPMRRKASRRAPAIDQRSAR